jgi:hypothetical protein
MRIYLHGLALGKCWKPFNSIVRSFDLHDACRFSIEQYITLLIARNKRHPGKWIGMTPTGHEAFATDMITVIVWLDAGTDLCNSPLGPWLGSSDAPFHTHFRPVTLYEPDIAFLAPRFRPDYAKETGHIPLGSLAQSISLLPRIYGESLEPEEAAADPIYALQEVFRFLAHSECQYLDMISSVLEANTTENLANAATTHEELRAILIHSHRALKHRQTQFTEMLDFLKLRCSTDMITPRSLLAQSSVARSCQDYEYLFSTAEKLVARCNHELNIIMSEISVEEARRGITQSKRTHKFTGLAAIYVPFTFGCSIFGMNFVEIPTVQQGFRLWAIVVVPTFFLSLLVLYWDPDAILKFWRRIVRVFY